MSSSRIFFYVWTEVPGVSLQKMFKVKKFKVKIQIKILSPNFLLKNILKKIEVKKMKKK